MRKLLVITSLLMATSISFAQAPAKETFYLNCSVTSNNVTLASQEVEMTNMQDEYQVTVEADLNGEAVIVRGSGSWLDLNDTNLASVASSVEMATQNLRLLNRDGIFMIYNDMQSGAVSTSSVTVDLDTDISFSAGCSIIRNL